MADPKPTPSPGPPVPGTEPRGTGGTGNTPDTYDDDQRATPYDRLRNLLTKREQAKKAGDSEALRDLNRRIERLLDNHPDNDRLTKEAESRGFNMQRLDDDGNENTEDDGGKNDAPGSKGGKGGNNDKGEPNRLPRGGRLIRQGDSFYIVWQDKFKGKPVTGMYKVPANMLDHYGLDKKDARAVTRQQLRRFNYLGSVADINLLGRRDPFEPFFEYIEDQFGLAPGMLRNKEVLGVLFESHMEKWDGTRLFNALQQTKWASKKSDERLEYLTLRPAEQKDRIQKAYVSLRDWAEGQFGELDYSKYFSDERLRKMAEKAASGAVGWDEDVAKSRIARKAENIAGSAAAIAKEESIGNSQLDIEDKARALREQAASWMGWKNVPTMDTIKGWAADILNKKRSDADFENWASETAHGLHKWLGTNEKFQDTADVYRQKSEALLGTTLSWDDHLLQDFTARDANGKPIADQRMALYDYEDLVRKDPRFRGSEVGIDRAYSVAGFINSMFNGQGGA